MQYIKGIGPQRAEVLMSEKIYSVRDLLYFFPRAYIDRKTTDSLKMMSIKLIAERDHPEENTESRFLRSQLTAVVSIFRMQKGFFGKKKKYLKMGVVDETGGMAEIMFWSFPDYYERNFASGDKIVLCGTPELNRYGQISFNQPEISLYDDSEFTSLQTDIIPVYKSGDAFKKSGITNKLLRRVIFSLIETELPKMPETLPQYLLDKFHFPDLHSAIHYLHSPREPHDIENAKLRMKFEEIFYFEMYLSRRVSNINRELNGIVIPGKSPLARKVYSELPFELTHDQKKVITEIARDMESGVPMNRLLQGDVGSGKTIVALLCMVSAVSSGFQVALMAPTEILAEQHYTKISNMLETYGLETVLLAGGQRKKQRAEVLEKIASGEAQVIIGTQALLFDVEYHNLGLVVIDEQHRFGVDQRAALIDLAKRSNAGGAVPHVLVMSATPIPRTLSLTVYGDLSVSVIRSMPQGRQPIMTRVVFESDLPDVYEFIRSQVNDGFQAYVIYPLVEKSEKLELKSAVEHFDILKNEIFPDLKCGLLHGQMRWSEKVEAMQNFKDKQYDILVSTTAVEVGIDVPNATVMLINDAHRYGLSQLHQLRGRVGRGSAKSYCILATKDHYIYQMKRNTDNEGERMANIIRLKTMERTNDGFEIAEADLQLRGPGDVLGTRQSGLPEFQFLDLVNDGEIISKAKNYVSIILNDDANLVKPENLVIRKTYSERYGNREKEGISLN